ncbi:MAG: PQQ-binding-like beta-propeller repeat protein [Acidobacteria bacterium]|nr:PQQ-binding-like beta-propeller repeat protein [Acidobacteriota bacterium]
MRKSGLTLCLLLAIAATPQAQNWPGFRGLHAAGTGDGEHPPLTWDADTSRNVAWKVAIPGLAHSSPIVWGDRLYVTTAVSRDAESVFRPGFSPDGRPASDDVVHSWRLSSLETSTGRIVWERVAHEGRPRSTRHPKSSQASSTPVTDGRYVVAFFGSEGLYCYDTDGRLVWKRDLGILEAGSIYYPDRQWGTASSPVIAGDKVILQADLQSGSFVAAYDLATGDVAWRTPREELPSWASPGFVAGSSPQVVTNGARYIRGYDVHTGRELWRAANTSEIAVPTPVHSNGLIFVTSGYGPTKPIAAIRVGALGDLSLPAGETSSRGIAWSSSRGGSYISTPLVYGRYLYTLSANGVLACYEASTGTLVYERRVADRGGAYSASPVAADGRIYLSSEDGEVHVVKAGSSYEVLATNVMGAPVMATPAISNGMIFIRTTTHLYGIGAPARP